jgi:hypothetical protein
MWTLTVSRAEAHRRLEQLTELLLSIDQYLMTEELIERARDEFRVLGASAREGRFSEIERLCRASESYLAEGSAGAEAWPDIDLLLRIIGTLDEMIERGEAARVLVDVQVERLVGELAVARPGGGGTVPPALRPSNPGEVYQMVYWSRSRWVLEPRELLEILTVSRKRNAESGVTGLLIYRNESFLQVLEGARDAVAETFARIRRDCRHHAPTIVLDGVVPARSYPSWSMGYQHLLWTPERGMEATGDLRVDPSQAPQPIPSELTRMIVRALLQSGSTSDE